jgi:hypothetical protein
MKNVQIASGCIKNWCESSEGVSRRDSEVIVRQRVAAMLLPKEVKNEELESCIKTAWLGTATWGQGGWSPPLGGIWDRLKPGREQ